MSLGLSLVQLFSAPPVNLLYVGVGNQGAAVSHWLLSSNQNICLPSPSYTLQKRAIILN